MTKEGNPTRPSNLAGGSLLIGCVADNNPKYVAQASRLVQSIRWFGGELSNADVLVCLIHPTEQECIEHFQKLGAFVRIVPFFSYFHHQPNKLRFLEMPEAYLYDYVMLMDCDTLVVQDFSPFIQGEALQAKIADGATVSFETFQGLFSLFGLPLPQPEYRCTYSNQPTIWYCNTGVVIFPQKILRCLYPTWRRYTTEVLRDAAVLEKLGNFCEQASLTLAFAENPVPYRELPVGMNFPLHRAGRNAPPGIADCDPLIIHYHDLTDASGFVQPTSHRLAQARIDAFNENLVEYRGRSVREKLTCDVSCREQSAVRADAGTQDLPIVVKSQVLRQSVGRLESRKTWRLLASRFKAVGCSYLPLLDFRKKQAHTTVDAGVGDPQFAHDRIHGSPIFVVGSMRSGTTILAELLGRHPDIVHCPFELKHIWSRVGGVAMASPKTGDHLCPQLGAGDASAVTASRLSRAFAREYRKNSEGKNLDAQFLSKNPHLCNKLPFVDRLFPIEARFIWIFRDLPCVVFSIRRLFDSVYQKRQLWHYWPEKLREDEIRCWQCFSDLERPGDLDPARFFPGGDIRFLAEYWLETNRAVSEFCRTNPKRTLAVREDELVGQSSQVLARIFAFLKIPTSIPILYERELDPGRNTIWIREMDETDRSTLLRFVREQSDEIDKVFPVENLASAYDTMLSRGEKGA